MCQILVKGVSFFVALQMLPDQNAFASGLFEMQLEELPAGCTCIIEFTP